MRKWKMAAKKCSVTRSTHHRKNQVVFRTIIYFNQTDHSKGKSSDTNWSYLTLKERTQNVVKLQELHTKTKMYIL